MAVSTIDSDKVSKDMSINHESILSVPSNDTEILMEAEQQNLQLQLKYQNRRPYKRGIDKFREVMQLSKPPLYKILKLHEVKDEIFKDIHEFWLTVDCNAQIPQEALNFDKGEMITIMNYVIMQA